MRTDEDWNPIDGSFCRVIEFNPLAVVQDGKIHALDLTTPYASVTLQCKETLVPIEGFVCHKVDFLNLWAAFKERPLGENEEVIIIYTKKNYKRGAGAFSHFLPRLIVWVCRKQTYEILTDDTFRPELKGIERFNAQKPIREWVPDVMEPIFS